MQAVSPRTQPIMKRKADPGEAGEGHLTIEGLARYVSVKSTNTVRAMVRRGELPPPDYLIAGRLPRWVPARLRAWQRQHRARLACEERVGAGDPEGARRELERLQRAVEELERCA